MLDRARAEVASLASRREDITKQLGHLSGVIDALAVPERPTAGAAEGRQDPTGTTPVPTPEDGATDVAPAAATHETTPDSPTTENERTDHE